MLFRAHGACAVAVVHSAAPVGFPSKRILDCPAGKTGTVDGGPRNDMEWASQS